MNRPAYNLEELSRLIAEHAYQRKVVEDKRFSPEKTKYGPDPKIKTKQDFANHIEKTVTDKNTKCFKTISGRDIYYNKDTNTLVVVNPNRDEKGRMFGGSAWRDKKHEKEYERLKSIEVDFREKNNIREPIQEKTGGIRALYPDRIKSGEEPDRQESKDIPLSERVRQARENYERDREPDDGTDRGR